MVALAGPAAADDFKTIDCDKSRITIVADGTNVCGFGSKNASFAGNWISQWRAENRAPGRYLAALYNQIETQTVYFPMSTFGDGTLVSLAKQMKATSMGSSDQIVGVNRLPFIVADGNCASWAKPGATTNRLGQFTSVVFGVFCTATTEELTDLLFKQFLLKINVNGEPIISGPDKPAQ